MAIDVWDKCQMTSIEQRDTHTLFNVTGTSDVIEIDKIHVSNISLCFYVNCDTRIIN